MSAWIRMVPLEEAEGALATAYQKVTTPHGTVDNVMKAHSLRPHTMEGHSALYKSVLHHTGNSTPVWFLECLGIYTSLANRCDYSVSHHFAGLTRLLKDAATAGCDTIGGLDMLIGQAQEQFEWWTGVRPQAGVMRAAATRRLSEFNADEDHFV